MVAKLYIPRASRGKNLVFWISPSPGFPGSSRVPGSPGTKNPRCVLIKWLCRVSVGLKIHAESSPNGSSRPAWHISGRATTRTSWRVSGPDLHWRCGVPVASCCGSGIQDLLGPAVAAAAKVPDVDSVRDGGSELPGPGLRDDLWSRASWRIRAQRELWWTLWWMLWLAPAGLRGGIKLEAYHQSRQPLPFSLCCPRSSGLRFVVQDVAASLGPAVAAAAIRFLTDVAASCLIPGSVFRHGCIHALGPGIVVARALWRPSGRLFRQGHFFIYPDVAASLVPAVAAVAICYFLWTEVISRIRSLPYSHSCIFSQASSLRLSEHCADFPRVMLEWARKSRFSSSLVWTPLFHRVWQDRQLGPCVTGTGRRLFFRLSFAARLLHVLWWRSVFRRVWPEVIHGSLWDQARGCPR